MKKWKCLKSDIVYDSRYFRVKKDAVKLPNGEEKEWTYWDSNDSAMVIAMTENKKLIMIKQYRYLVGSSVIEFPSGHINEEENIEIGACREFAEETGYICTNLKKLGEFYETYGQLNRKIHIYFTDNVQKASNKYYNSDEIKEDIKVVLVGFDKAVEMTLNNKIVAMGSSLAVMLLKAKLES